MTTYKYVYAEAGTVPHAIATPGHGGEALCGRTPWPGGAWTDAQESHRAPVLLGLCVGCAAVIRHREGSI
ncbi:hypothetical protein [Streptomyces sp. NPDC001774]